MVNPLLRQNQILYYTHSRTPILEAHYFTILSRILSNYWFMKCHHYACVCHVTKGYYLGTEPQWDIFPNCL